MKTTKARVGICIDYSKKGICPSQYVRYPYISYVRDSGNIPLILPLLPGKNMIPEILKGIDLVLITGGGPGTNPRYVRHSLKKQNPQRYQFEKRIIKYALRNKIPLLGICRGAQMIAEVMGGKIRNLQPAKRLLHNQTKKPQMGVHWIRLESGILLHKALRASRIKVNSMHQQEAYSLPGSLVCSAISDDNVIEAFESKRKNNSVIGLQFHPERLYKRRRVFLKIITSLVENK